MNDRTAGRAWHGPPRPPGTPAREMTMTLTDDQRVVIARDNGIRIPDLAMQVARDEQVPYWAVCAFLMQETGGGRNVWGNDDTWMRGIPLRAFDLEQVTKDSYLIYKLHRARFGNQGVGPMQLTSDGFQDAADTLGGCWDPEANLRAACQWIRAQKATRSWHDVARNYNGSEAYADEMDERFAFWRPLMTD